MALFFLSTPVLCLSIDVVLNLSIRKFDFCHMNDTYRYWTYLQERIAEVILPI